LNKGNYQETEDENIFQDEDLKEIEQEQKIDNYSETEYEKFIKFILSPN